MTQNAGCSAAIVARMRSRLISASTRTCAPVRSRRRERSASWAPDSSPVTYSTFIWPASASMACSSSVLLPMPGSPPISTTPPATMPPPSTRSSSSMPVGVRAISPASMSASVATGWLRVSAWKRFLAAAAPVGSPTPSSSVFHASQWGQRPSHFGLVPPQAEQV